MISYERIEVGLGRSLSLGAVLVLMALAVAILQGCGSRCGQGTVERAGKCVPLPQFYDSGSAPTDCGTPEKGPADAGAVERVADKPSTGPCVDGETAPCYTGPKDSEGKGQCRKGVRTCVNGKWARECVGQVLPSTEICNRRDDDCDGVTDEHAIPAGKLKPSEVGVCRGEFMMGSPNSEPGREDDEGPRHKVTLTNSFALWRHEVTQAEFLWVMGYNPSLFKECGPTCPVEMVSWHEAAAFCNALSSKRGLPQCFDCTGSKEGTRCKPKSEYAGVSYYSCKGYRLPTEAELEYAYRAGTVTALYNGPIGEPGASCAPSRADSIAWTCSNSEVTYKGCTDRSKWGGPRCVGTHPVAAKLANPWGMFDLAGNVYEWAFDFYARFSASSATDPVGPSSGAKRTLRGGSWPNRPYASRAANRGSAVATLRTGHMGFRPARTLQ